MRIQHIPIIAILILLFLVGSASAVSNTYTQNGTWNLQSALNASNTYDSSKISSMMLYAAPVYTHVDPENISGLVARYKFNGNLVNSVNASNNGVASGNVTFNATGGKYNGSVVFNVNNTTGDYVLVNDPVLGATAFTFSCWINSNYTLYQTPFMDYNTTVKNIIISSYAVNSMRLYVGDGTNVSSSLTNSNLTNNSWHMITATFNGTTGTMAIWVDMNKSSASTTISRIGSVQANGSSCAISRNNQQFSSTQGYINGSLDDMCFWNRSLTDAEIQSLYYSQLANVTVKTNVGSSATIPDNGGNLNIPYSSGSITSLVATVPSSVVVNGVTIRDYTHTVSPISYGLTVVSSQEYTPVASFTNNPSYGTKPVTVSFTDSSTNYPTSWNWNFGDGSTSHSQNPTHQYATAGTYTATLTASNGQGGSSASKIISVLPAAGDNGVINNAKRVAIYIENATASSITHDSGFGSMLHEYNCTYLTNSTVPSSLNTANFDLLVVGGGDNSRGSCTNSTAHYINEYIASGGSVWFISEPRNESNTYMTDMSNATWGLPANRFYCLGALTQQNITGGSSLTINTADPATAFLTSPQTILATVSRYTDSRNFGGTSGVNAYGYNYTELVYYNGDTSKCQVAKVWNDTTGSRVVYSNLQAFVSGGDNCYFNATTGSKLFNNMKQWVLKLDNNSMQVSVTYPRGDRQFVACFDDLNFTAPTSQMDNFFAMIDAQPNDIGITSFVIPEGRQNGTTPGSMVSGYNYLVSKGVDVNTIHPHQNDIDNPSPASVAWGLNTAPLADMQTALSLYMQNYSAGISNNPSLKFYSVRFPQTKVNTTSSQAAVNLGFKIASDYGPAATMGSISESHINMRYAQKQKILSGVKTSQIEIEAPASYDTAYAETGTTTDWKNNVQPKILLFLNCNYPSVHLLDGHYQWSMTNASWTAAVRDMLWYTDNQTAYTAYTNLSTLALYEIALQDANIRVSTSGYTTTATITAVEPIHDFTLKFMNITRGVTVLLDGTQLTADHVIYEDGYYYVFADIPAGTHTLTVTDSVVTGGSKYISHNGATSVNISNGAFVKNNAAAVKPCDTHNHIPYTNCTNVIGSTNIVYVNAHKKADAVSATFIPNGGDINVTIAAWNNSYKHWNESSATHAATMSHVIGGFAPNQYTALNIDGVATAEFLADANGYIAFSYTGGYSEHEFEATTTDLTDFDISISPISSGATDNLDTISVNSDAISYTASPSILGSTIEKITTGYNLAILMIVILAMLGIVRALGY